METRSACSWPSATDRQRAYLEQVFEDVPEGIALLDDGDRVIHANREFLRMFGYGAQEVAEQPINELIVPPRLLAEAERITRATLEGERIRTRTVRRDRHGREMHVSLLATPIRLDGGQIGTVAIYRDISPRVQVEQERALLQARDRAARLAAEAAERRARFLADVGTLLAGSLDPVATFRRLARLSVPTLADFCIIDRVEDDGSLRRVAAAHRQPEREVLLPPDVPPTPGLVAEVRRGEAMLIPEVTEEVLERLAPQPEHRARLRALGLRSYMVVPLIARERTLGTLNLALTEPPRRYGNEELTLATEVAHCAALVLDNARLYARAQEAVAARDRVLAVVSHDLRNPLASILLDASSLAEIPPECGVPANVRERAGRIAGASERMDRMIGDLLDVAGLQAGCLRLVAGAEPVDLLVERAIGVQRTLAETRGIRLEPVLPASPMQVRADGDRLVEVFANLVGNALRVTEPGGRVSVSASRSEDGVCFAVRDTGPGIAPEHLPHLFEAYWQGPASERGESGLGLAIARWIVEAHGGRIWVESEPGEGATFLFTLPEA